MKVDIFKVRFNLEVVKYDKKTKVSTTEKSWPEETKVVAVEDSGHVRAALSQGLADGQSVHIRQIDQLMSGVEFYLHVNDDESETVTKAPTT